MMMHAASICGTGRKLPTSSTSPHTITRNAALCRPFSGTEIKRQWEKKLGISVELETATGDAFWAEKDNGTVTLTGVIAEYADMMAYLQSWNYDYTYGEEGNQSDTVQKCLRDAERQTDEQIRLSTLYKAEKALMEDVPMIPLQLRKESLLLNRNLTGFETSMNLAGGGYEFLYADFK